MSDAEKRSAIEKDKGDRQAAQAKQADATRASAEAEAIAAVSGIFSYVFLLGPFLVESDSKN
jgi:hypothetical protein